MKSKEDAICELIRSKVKDACQLQSFADWLRGVSIDSGDIILVNNSFLYREKVSTNKNSKYLSLWVPDGTIEKSEVKVAETSSFNVDFKHFNKRSPLPLMVSLVDAVQEELRILGQLVFILIGEMDYSQEFSKTINHSMFEDLVFRPRLEQNLTIEGKSIIIHEMANIDLLWSELTMSTKQAGLAQDELPEPLFKAFETAIKELRKKCYLSLKLPVSGKTVQNVFLDSIIEALKQNAHEYRESLEKCSGDHQEPQEFNNVLRIAYNFAGEVVTMLKLMSLWDLPW